MDRSSVAVITDIHGNLPALEAALARIEELGIDQVYCGGDLVGYGPWPNEVCDLIQERDIPTIYGNYDYAIGRDEEDCMCAYPDAARAGARSALRRLDSRAHQPRIEGLHARAALRPALRARRAASTARSRLPAQGQRVPLRGQAGQDLRANRRGSRLRRAGLRPHPQALDPRVRRHPVRQLRIGRQAEGRRPARRLRRSSRERPVDVEARIERFEYDAEYASSQVAAAGLPSEYAEKLLVAA